ncbi:hypothetical protein DFH09DRAFT_1344788 [Mycena vulgaris]|nr:hypothetical protein DFH09DRAFT_1344788 [Mycena vulgaris]
MSVPAAIAPRGVPALGHALAPDASALPSRRIVDTRQRLRYLVLELEIAGDSVVRGGVVYTFRMQRWIVVEILHGIGLYSGSV